MFSRLLLLALCPILLCGQQSSPVLLVVNDSSALSRQIGQYYAERRHIPATNVCDLHATDHEEISRSEYDAQIARPIADCLRTHKLTESVLYIVTTSGVPLKIHGNLGLTAEAASVDSELTLLYADLHGQPHAIPAGVRNPFFGQTTRPFRHPDFPMYLVTRLTGFDFADVKGLIDRSLAARNRGRIVIDLKANDTTPGNRWLLDAAKELPRDRVVLDITRAVLAHQDEVVAYASWGSNDPDRKERHLGLGWLPGAIMTEYVSTNGRTFERPSPNWQIGDMFAGSGQTLTADYIHDGATGASGHVYEPYLQFNPRPDILFPAYFHGRNLAESYYLSIPVLSWMNIVVGDPLCTLGPP